MATCAFAISACGLLVGYVVYPVMLLMLSNLITKAPSRETDQNYCPSVSVVISAYNEADRIAQRISNLLESPYSGPKEVIVVSDGSTDDTDEIVSRCPHDSVRLYSLPVRSGKSAAYNRGIPEARGEILVLTDADCVFRHEPDALTELVRPFRDPRVGLVKGRLNYEGSHIGNMYQRYEDFLRNLESDWGTLAGALGPIYAMRRSLWEPTASEVITDFFHPIMVCTKGFQTKAVPRAVAVTHMGHEFNRQVRMVAQGALVYFSVLPKLLAQRLWKCLFVLTCHKLFRWLTIPLFVSMFFSGLVLFDSGLLFKIVVVLQGAFVVFALLGNFGKSMGLPAWLDTAYRFFYLNWAAVIGLTLYLQGRTPIMWEPRTK